MEQSLQDSGDTEVLVARAAEGDSQALSELMDRYRDRLERLVGLRMDRRLRGRVGASDIVQEALIEAARRLSDYSREPPTGFFLWLRSVTANKLQSAHRQHLGTQKRDAAQEVSLYRRAMPEACSVSLGRGVRSRAAFAGASRRVEGLAP